ncbi:MAG: SUMF1/EgtB/PvdO family nonheme iron enzyme [Anaerolineae bacterium]|nr:SUMF1/EgtB/PvdO family nonheme iron enzyme [Anaerolineae bacterium]
MENPDVYSLEEAESPHFWAAAIPVLLFGILFVHFFFTWRARWQKSDLSHKSDTGAPLIILAHTPMPTIPPLPTAAPPPGAQRLSPLDGIVQVYIPAGNFQMGRSASGDELSDDQPQHTVWLDAFWIGLTPATNAAYSLCVASGDCKPPCSPETNPHYYDPVYASHPVVYVTWQAAQDYCRWAGGRLPTEAEWERAAGGDGWREYPWGEADPAENLANLGGFNESTMPVGSFPEGASPFGVLDMGGNVREWTADWYAPDYYPVSPAANPQGPPTGTERVLRGASWNDPWYYAKLTRRYAHAPDSAGANRGFRCAFDE